MKDLSLLALVTQLGLSVAVPPAGFVLLARWLQRSLGWGNWVLWTGIVLGAVCAVDGLVHTLMTMSRLAKNSKSEDEQSPVSFHDHD